MKRIERLKNRNKRITERFIELKDKKYKNVQAYSDEKIWLMLEEEFALSQSYLEKIVFGRVSYKKRCTSSLLNSENV